MSGYDFVYKNRTSDIRGGVAIYIKKSLKFKINEELSIFENNIFESLCIEVKVNDKKMFISNVYRPTGDVIGMSKMDKLEYFLDKFDFLQDKLSSLNVDSFICCDTNIDILQYSSFDKAKQLVENSFANGFLSTIFKPTHINPNSATCIDNIFTNCLSDSYNTGIIKSRISDHYPVFIVTNMKKMKHSNSNFIFRPMNDDLIDQFKLILSNHDWDNVINCEEPQNALDIFLDEFNPLIDLMLPLKKVKFNKNIHKIEPFMSQAILRSRRTKLELEKAKINNPNSANIINFRNYKNRYNSVVRAAKQLYFKNVLEENRSNIKKTWSILKDAMRKNNDKSSCIEELHIDNKMNCSKNDIPTCLNEYFTSIADEINAKINPSDKNPINYLNDYNSNLTFQCITSQKLIDIVQNMKNKSSTDMFGISNFRLKKIIDSIVIPLRHIFNLSISKGVVPNKLKIAKVIPIFKLSNKPGSDKTQPGNFRPISLLPILSKILEKIIAEQLVKYLNLNNILHKHQYGFQTKKSTIHPIMHLINNISKASNEKK